MYILFVVALIVLFSSINSVKAVDFDGSINAVNGGLSETLLNFSITNNDASNNITKLNITLNSGFSYKSGARDDIMTFNLLESGTVLSWANTNYVVNKSSTVYLWVYSSTPSRTGQENINISTVDNTGAFLSKNITLDLIDVTAPKWNSNTTVYSIPTSYYLNKNHTLNITWTDNIGLEEVKMEFNGANYTNTSSIPVTNIGSGVYGINFMDLPANSYNYRWFAKDSNRTENVTNTLIYNVSKAMNPINVYFDGTVNTDKTVNLGETLNITVTGKGNVYLYENGTLIGSGGSPLTYQKSLSSIGINDYTVNGTSTANYTTNSTGATYRIVTDYPPPRYSVTTSIPTTWSANSYASFNVTWSDPNDSNGYDTALIQLNHSGTATNYTMTEISGTNRTTYELNLTAPMALSWRIYANNSYGSWNSTNMTTSVINKLTPTLSLSIIPSWDVVKGTQTTVKCSSDDVSVNLYRNGVSVSNPDTQTLSTGEYFYICNNTETSDYSSTYDSEILTIYNFIAIVSFIDAEPVVTIMENTSNQTTVTVKNTGNATQTVTFTIENITSITYSINSTSANLEYNKKASFLVNFTLDDSIEIGDYDGSYKVTTSNSSYSYPFILRVTPDETEYETIENSITLYKTNLNKLWSDLNQTKKNYPDINFTSVEQMILDVKEKIEMAGNYIDNGNYYAAYQLIDEIGTKIASAENELNSTKLSSGIFPSWVRKALITTTIIILIVLGYLLWPVSGYDTRSGKYRHKTPKQKGIEKLSEAKGKIKEKIPIEKVKFVKDTIKEKIPLNKEIEEVRIEEIQTQKTGNYKKSTKKTKIDLRKKLGAMLKIFKKRKKDDSEEYVELDSEYG